MSSERGSPLSLHAPHCKQFVLLDRRPPQVAHAHARVLSFGGSQQSAWASHQRGEEELSQQSTAAHKPILNWTEMAVRIEVYTLPDKEYESKASLQVYSVVIHATAMGNAGMRATYGDRPHLVAAPCSPGKAAEEMQQLREQQPVHQLETCTDYCGGHSPIALSHCTRGDGSASSATRSPSRTTGCYHHRHRSSPSVTLQRLSSQPFQPGHLTLVGVCTSGPQ